MLYLIYQEDGANATALATSVRRRGIALSDMRRL